MKIILFGYLSVFLSVILNIIPLITIILDNNILTALTNPLTFYKILNILKVIFK